MGMIDGEGRFEARPEWTALESWVRGKVQVFIQDLLEAEVTDLLGRKKSVSIYV